MPKSKKQTTNNRIASESKRENKQIDFKEKFDPTNVSDWCQILKDILAMANSGGGVLLFGIKDNGDIIEGYNKEIILNIDQATIVDKINSYTGENFDEIKVIEVERDGIHVPAFLIEGSLTPIVFIKHGADVSDRGKQRPAFVKGSVYFRHGAKSEPGNTNDIRSALDRAVNRAKKNWFEGVRKISNIKDGDEVIVKAKNSNQIAELQKIPGKIVSSSDAISFRPDNASEIWPHRSKEALKEVNEKLTDGKKITIHDLLCIRKSNKIDENSKPDFVYRPYKENSPRYSDNFVDWIVESINTKANFLEQARDHYKVLTTSLKSEGKKA